MAMWMLVARGAGGLRLIGEAFFNSPPPVLQGAQFSVQEVEVITATVDLDEVVRYRGEPHLSWPHIEALLHPVHWPAATSVVELLWWLECCPLVRLSQTAAAQGVFDTHSCSAACAQARSAGVNYRPGPCLWLLHMRPPVCPISNILCCAADVRSRKSEPGL